MNREERRKKILEIISSEKEPVSGTKLAAVFGVSRQVIVQDIAILRVDNKDILATSQGYIRNNPPAFKRIFKICHEDCQIEDELNTIVDAGGTVLDVYIEHCMYGKITGDLSISSRLDVKNFMESFQRGEVNSLKNLTFGVHFHTVEAGAPQILDIIEEELKRKKYLIP